VCGLEAVLGLGVSAGESGVDMVRMLVGHCRAAEVTVRDGQ
jgi:hypothetical protein